jgi:hypothetical protein
LERNLPKRPASLTTVDERYRYLASCRADYEAYVQRADAEYANDDTMSYMPSPGTYARMRLVLQLLDLGVEPEDMDDGLLIEGKVVIGVRARKYRYVSDRKYRWYYYSTLPALLEKLRTQQGSVKIFGLLKKPLSESPDTQ